MSKYVVLFTLLLALLILRFAEAQQRSRTFRVGVLEPGFKPSDAKGSSACNIGFREGLRELGWIEGQSLRIEERHGEFKPEAIKIAIEKGWTIFKGHKLILSV